MTAVAIALVLLMTVAPLAVAALRNRPVAPLPRREAEDRINIGNAPVPDIMITNSAARAERSMTAQADHLARVRRLIERYPERGAAVIRTWMDVR